MRERLVEATGATSAQIELNKKREAEIVKLRKDIEEANIQQEATLASLKKKQQDSGSEMTEQQEQLNKMKAKIEKDKLQIMHEIADTRAATDEVVGSKASAEKTLKSIQIQLNDQGKKIGDLNLNLGDFESQRRKLTAENTDALNQLQEMNNAASMLSKQKISLSDQLSEVQGIANHEAKERSSLLSKYRNAEHEVNGMKDHYEEELCAKENLIRQLSKLRDEAELMRVKYEKDGLAKIEELEMGKLKMQARLSEAESTIEQQTAKLAQIEKAKSKLSVDVEGMGVQLEQIQILNSSMDKKAKNFDRIVGEQKQRVDSLSMDLDRSQNETRIASAELFRVKSAYEEIILQLEEVRRENKSLSNEIQDIMNQITEGGRSIHEIDKIRKRLEAEKLELQSALEEDEATLEQEENKVLRCQLELTQVKTEIERRIAEKDEEFAMVRKNQAKALDSMQSAFETEAKGKAEALRMKKKLEADSADLTLALEHAIAGNAETQNTIKKYQLQVRDAQLRVDEESAAKSVAADAKVTADRKAAAMQNALEEGRALLETSDRQRRSAEQELADTN